MRSALETLTSGRDLAAEEAEIAFAQLVAGQADPIQFAALLAALKTKGETAGELTGAARALLAAATPFPRPDYVFADTCGTGGDHAGTINVSTAAAFVSAAAGLPVAKHGNRSVSSMCGSADVLELLGAKLDLTPAQSRVALDQTGVCFLFAPLYHPGMKHAGRVRQALKIRTIMNVLGPLLNPARPDVQIMGVSEPRLIAPAAETLLALGAKAALVVHGSGLDEIALHGATHAARLHDGRIDFIEINPEQAGLPRADLDALKGGGPEENAATMRTLLSGKGDDAHAHAVALNAGALLWIAGLAPTLKDGAAKALDALQSGEAGRRLDAFVEATRSAADA
jgi:anthranilate phosphoribosyltransferase